MIDEDGEITRYHFNTTTDAMITMFIVLTGENWNYVLNTVALAHPDKSILAVIFFSSAVLIGNFMLLNLFLAILLKFLQDAVNEGLEAKLEERKKLLADKEKAVAISKQKEEEFRKKIYNQEVGDSGIAPAVKPTSPAKPADG